jgi:YfiH family protein
MQIHGEKIVVLTEHAAHNTQHAEEKIKGLGLSGESGIWNLESGVAGKNLDIKISALPASPFHFDEGDAMVGDLPGVSMGVRTADCLPLLIADRIRGTAAVVHCGWRSLALGLAGKVVSVMSGLMGSSEEDLLAAIGPSIGPCCYEVGEEVREAFPAEQREEGLFEKRGQSLYLDLASGVKTQLLGEGMAPETVEEIAACTSCNPDLFWSWRARKDEERMVSFITVREPFQQ